MRPGLDNMRIQAFLIAAATLKQIYKTKDADAVQIALEDFAEDGWSKKYPAIGPSWLQNWSKVIPFLRYCVAKTPYGPSGFSVPVMVSKTITCSVISQDEGDVWGCFAPKAHRDTRDHLRLPEVVAPILEDCT